MVDRLKNATEHLQAPDCPACHIEMRWFRSELVRDEPVSLIVHQFLCPACEGIEQRETRFKQTPIPPHKLSAPLLAFCRKWHPAA